MLDRETKAVAFGFMLDLYGWCKGLGNKYSLGPLVERMPQKTPAFNIKPHGRELYEVQLVAASPKVGRVVLVQTGVAVATLAKDCADYTPEAAFHLLLATLRAGEKPDT
jgi:hypothetical protein